MTSRTGARLALACLLALTARPVWADGVIRDGIGAVPIGRGGNNVASYDNGVIIYDNPAGMANVEGNGLFEGGVDGLFPDLSFSNAQTPRTDSTMTPLALPFFSAIQRSADGQFAYGLGVFVPAGFGTNWNINSPILGPQQYRSFAGEVEILPALAYRVTDRWSVGGNFGPGITYAQLDGPFVLQTGALKGVPALIDLHATSATIAWSVGTQYRLDDRTMLGLTYIAPTRYALKGSATVSARDILPLPVSIDSRFNADVDVTFPRTVSGGVTHAFGEDGQHRAMLQVMWFDWQDAFNNVGLRLTNGSNPLVSALAGPTITDRFPLNWYDTVSVRLGYEYVIDPTQVVRLGYIYHPQPIPNATLTPYIPATLKQAVSVGYGKQWFNWGVNVAYQYSFGGEQTVGQSGLVGGDFSNSQVGAQAHWLSLSVMYRY